MVWTNPFGDIFLDSDIKLYEFEDVQKYSAYNDGPKSSEFCRFYSSSSSKELDGFDSSIFWSTGFLWEHFGTCGLEGWDLELQVKCRTVLYSTGGVQGCTVQYSSPLVLQYRAVLVQVEYSPVLHLLSQS